MDDKDINIRIDKRTHKKLKMTSARYGLSIKELVGLLALSKFPITVDKKKV